jgi:hypothetical protein
LFSAERRQRVFFCVRRYDVRMDVDDGHARVLPFES